MVSFQDSINQIKESIRDHDFARQSHEQTQREHERILDEYDRMTRDRASRIHKERSSRRDKPPPSMRFRFKHDKSSSSGGGEKRKSRHPSHRHRHRHRRDEDQDEDERANIQQYAAHPFSRPRESDHLDPSISASPQPEATPNNASIGPDDAFRESLFDAMADDEGAAYWEGVYGDSIHSYPRPSVKDDQGHLEKMTDDQYVEYVKAKMWEKKHPEILRERQMREEREQDETARKRKRRPVDEDDEYEEDFEWVGNEEKGYERRYTGARRSRPKTEEPRRDKSFMSDVDAALARGAKRKEAKKWQQAWSSYQQRWTDLKSDSAHLQGEELLKAIPWPVNTLSAKDVSKENVEDFFSNAPLEDEELRTKTLKDESVNWHPDRFQRRFGGSNVDAETLKLATSVFQTIYEMWERRRAAK